MGERNFDESAHSQNLPCPSAVVIVQLSVRLYMKEAIVADPGGNPEGIIQEIDAMGIYRLRRFAYACPF